MFNLFLVAHDDGKFISVGESLLDSLVAILGVFLVLLIIIGAVKLLSLIKQNKKEEVKEETATPVVNNQFYKVNENDENQMAAVLVASIDFYEETKQAPVVLGIREVK